MTASEYRNKHRRCRTCMFAQQNRYGSFYGHSWFCKAKGQIHEGTVASLKLKGCLCDLYRPKPVEDKEIPF